MKLGKLLYIPCIIRLNMFSLKEDGFLCVLFCFPFPLGYSIGFLLKNCFQLQSSHKKELLIPTETIYPQLPEAAHFLPLLNNIIMKIICIMYAWWLVWHITNKERAAIFAL